MWLLTESRAYLLTEFVEIFVKDPSWLQDTSQDSVKYGLFGKKSNGEEVLFQTFCDKAASQTELYRIIRSIENKDMVIRVGRRCTMKEAYLDLFNCKEVK